MSQLLRVHRPPTARPRRVVTPRRRPARGLLTVVLLLLAGLLAGCAADGASEDAAAPQEAAAGGAEAEAGGDVGAGPEDADAGDGEAAADDGSAGESSDGTTAAAGAGGQGDVDVALGASTAVQRGRKIVTTDVAVAVEDVPAAAQQVRDLAVAAGGFVAGEQTVGGEQPSARLTLRLPVTGADEVTDDVVALGVEVSRVSEVEPVEGRLVDLESRVETQRAGVDRVRALLAEATTLEDVLALEQELTRRQADLESLDAQRQALSDQAALATVNVSLGLPEDVEAPVEDAEPLPPFLEGLRGGWEALAASTGVLLLVVGGLLPWAVAAAVLGVLVVLVVRVVRRTTGAGVRAAPARVEAQNEA
jgi:hypothetical protein